LTRSPETLPGNLQALTIYNELNVPVPKLPDTLTDLLLKDFPRELALPRGLKKLSVISFCHALSRGVLPLRLNEVSFPLLPGVLPASLIELSFHAYEHGWAVGVLPANLLKLFCGRAAHHALQPGVLPQSLTDLTLLGYAH